MKSLINVMSSYITNTFYAVCNFCVAGLGKIALNMLLKVFLYVLQNFFLNPVMHVVIIIILYLTWFKYK